MVHPVLSYLGTDESSLVNKIYVGDKLSSISSTTIRNKLCSAVDSMGQDRLGFAPANIGTHFVRSGAAMSMYLA